MIRDRSDMVDSIDLQKVPAANEGKAEQRGATKRLIAAKCLSIMVSAATMLLWGDTFGYDLWIRFGVTLGALLVLFQALQSQHYPVAAAFAVLIVIFNPFVPAFPFTGPATFVVVLSTASSCIAALIWLRSEEPARKNSPAAAAGHSL
jgi:uncharacterized protein DUF6804